MNAQLLIAGIAYDASGAIQHLINSENALYQHVAKVPSWDNMLKDSFCDAHFSVVAAVYSAHSISVVSPDVMIDAIADQPAADGILGDLAVLVK
jgi:hypothetical protein